MIEIAVALAAADSAVKGIKKAINIGKDAKECLTEFMALFDAQDQIQRTANNDRAKLPQKQQDALDSRSTMSEAMESVIAARKVREMTEELRQYLIWSGQGDIWDEIQSEHTAIIQRRKAAELAAQRAREKAMRQRKELALIAFVLALGGLILFHLVSYIIHTWPK